MSLRAAVAPLGVVAAAWSLALTAVAAPPVDLVAGMAPTPWVASADVQRGRALLANRAETGCVMCHAVPGLPQGGDLGPSLAGVAQRSTAGQLRLRIADARSYNPGTLMPPYLSTQGLQGVASAYQGLTTLTPQGLEDIVAYLMQNAR